MSAPTSSTIQILLSSNGISSETVIPLTGGNANFVWRSSSSSSTPTTTTTTTTATTSSRTTTTPPSLPQTLIVKHAAPYVARNPQIPFPVNRLDNEVTVLEWARTHLPSPPNNIQQQQQQPTEERNPNPNPNPNITIPEIHAWFPPEKVLVMSDVGPITLKAACLPPTTLATPSPSLNLKTASISSRLGRWLAILHSLTRTQTRAPPFGGGSSGGFDDSAAKAIYSYPYRHLAGAMAALGYEASLGREIDEVYGGMIADEEVCICHGDFWPGNVILRPGGAGGDDDDDRLQQEGEVEINLAVVDWEMVRRGHGATDVGQFAAEAWLLERFHRGSSAGLLEGFLNGYKAQGGLVGAQAFEERVAIQMGVHLVYWPTRVDWTGGDKEETRRVVEVGMEILRRAREGDLGWVRREVWGGVGLC